MELQNFIKVILASNRFVSLPGLGSFISTYKSATLSDDGETFNPPHEEISFDVTRKFNDEAFQRFLVQQHEMDESKAEEAVANFVNGITTKLDNNEHVHFDGVGSLGKTKNGEIEFTPEADDKRVASTFGLETMEVKPIASQQSGETAKTSHATKATTTEKHQPKTTHKRSRTPLFVGIGAGVLLVIIIAVLYILYPVSQYWDQKEEIAQAIPETINSEEHDSLDETAYLTTDSIDNHENNAIQQDSLTEQKKQQLRLETDKKAALYYSEPVPQEQKTYYIISGSFTRLDNAQVHLQNLEKKGYKPEILQSNGSYRVSMVKYSDKNRALRELERLRKEKPYQSVWLLGL